MPLDVIMPALGMAQETGVIVAWHKKPGDAVAEGDVLFEVETDKATMEVEAQGSGYLAGVTAGEGEEVAVGRTIARITDSAEDAPPGTTSGTAPGTPPAAGADPGADDAAALPEGRAVIMPTLGMAQDSGLLVAWRVDPGGRVGADDPLFEVETDKSTVEVPAGVDGYLAARLAEAGEEVPTGRTIAIVSPEPPKTPVTRRAGEAAGAGPAAGQAPAEQAPAGKPPSPPGPARTEAAPPARGPAPAAPGRLLASPKARRLALEQGLDLARLAAAGHPQPFHARDIEVLKTLPADAAAPGAGTGDGTGGPATRRLSARIPVDGFAGFAAWAAAEAGLDDPAALLAGLAGGCLARETALVAHETPGRRRLFDVPCGAPLGQVTDAGDGPPDLVLRDLRHTRISELALGAGAAPVLTLMADGDGLALTLECTAGQLSADAAVALLAAVADRLEQPLRALL